MAVPKADCEKSQWDDISHILVRVSQLFHTQPCKVLAVNDDHF